MTLAGVSCVALDFGGTIATPGPVPDSRHIHRVLRDRFGYVAPAGLAGAVESARLEAREAYRRTGRQTPWDAILADAARRASAELPDTGAVVAAMWESVPDGQVDPAAAAAVRRLRQDGFVLILACNTQRPLAVRRRTLAGAGLDDCFASLVLSSVVGAGKPDPAFYRAVREAAREHAGCGPGGVVFVGDTPGSDVTGPLRSGMRAVLVAREAPPAELPGEVPVISRFADLPALLDRRDGR